ncbi:MAG: IPT/TIG domain-containing protein, partial [Actinomycetota bacterium]
PKGVSSEGLRGSWKARAPLSLASTLHAADYILGRGVLVTGGSGTRVFGNTPDDNGAIFDRTALYDPAVDRWKGAGIMQVPRYMHASMPLPAGPLSLCGAKCGRILVTGGASGDVSPGDPIKSAEIYTFKPIVTGITPPSGPLTGGTETAISGTALAGATKVTFEGEPPLICGAKGIARCWVDEALPDQKIYAIAPPHAVPEKVHVTVETDPGFVSARTDSDLFAYDPLAAPGVDVGNSPSGVTEAAKNSQPPPPTITSGSAGSAQSANAAGRAVTASPLVLPPGGVAPSTSLIAQTSGLQAAGMVLAGQSQTASALSAASERRNEPAPQNAFSRLDQPGLGPAWAVAILLAAGMGACLCTANRRLDAKVAAAWSGSGGSRRPAT